MIKFRRCVSFKYVVSKKEKKKERSKNIFETFEKVWQSKKEQSIFLEISSMNNNIPIPYNVILLLR